MFKFFNCAKFFMAAFLALTAEAEAQPQNSKITTEISGEVMDQRGDLIAGAQISLSGVAPSMWKAESDTRGRFQFDGLRPGDYTLIVAAQGFATREERVTLESVSASRRLTITLYPAISE